MEDDTSSARISTPTSWYSHIIFELHLVHELQVLYVQLVICVMKQPCTFKEWIDMRNLTQTELSRRFSTLQFSESQGKYLQELEKH
jgi:hypothetical protein